jgi:Tetratricopeptide repeat
MNRGSPHYGTLIALAWSLAVAVGLGCGDRQTFAADPNPADTVRPAIGQPLRAAQALIAAQNYTAALAKIRQADAFKNKTRYEAFVVDELRGFAEKGAGDNAAAIKSFESVIADGQLSAGDQARFAQEIAIEYYNTRDYPNAIQWAVRSLKADGTAVETHILLAQSYYLTGDYAGAARELQSQIAAAHRGNRPPPENQLVMLADCALKQNDDPAYAAHLQQLVLFYPKKQYWVPLLHQVERNPAFAGRLQLDLDRLKLAAGTLDSADNYLEMAELALADGLPREAEGAIEQGYTAGVLGTGPGAERQNRLRALAVKSVAEDQRGLAQSLTEAKAQQDGTALVNIGQDYISYGQVEKGLTLIEEGTKRGSLKHPEDARLRLGVAYLLAGQKAKAVQILQTIRGADGAADLAHLWIIYAQQAG